MSDQPIKAVFRYDWSEALATLVAIAAKGVSMMVAGVPATIPLGDDYVDTIVEQALVKVRAQATAGAMEYLEGIGRLDHLLNTYANLDRETGQMTIVVVLNDRDTAIMLKLAMS